MPAMTFVILQRIIYVSGRQCDAVLGDRSCFVCNSWSRPRQLASHGLGCSHFGRGLLRKSRGVVDPGQLVPGSRHPYVPEVVVGARSVFSLPRDPCSEFESYDI